MQALTSKEVKHRLLGGVVNDALAMLEEAVVGVPDGVLLDAQCAAHDDVESESAEETVDTQ